MVGGGGGLISWIEWQKKAWSDAAVESKEEFPRSFCILIRPSGIECPNIHKTQKYTRACRANLMDTNILVECGSERRRVVHCEVCSWWGCRLMGE
jgi:hypothetical protein